MTPTVDQPPVQTGTDTDLSAAILRVLAGSEEPLTLSKIRSQLPTALRSITLEDLTDALQRQVAANMAFQYPKYRSAQDRFWDRPMPVHIAALLRQTVEAGPLPWSELRRKLPAYAVGQAEAVLHEQVRQGLLHRHPRQSPRGGDRYGTQPPQARDYLQPELSRVFQNLEQLGFSQAQIRQEAIQLLHDEEWAPASPPVPEPKAAASTPEQPTSAGASDQQGTTPF
jgi:hypothetical protein